MLHEVLLALSGHPSPLFGDREDGSTAGETDFPLLSPSEKALLHSLGQLSKLHLRLKRHLDSISSSHPSIICRATATSIQQTHLARFQQRILDVEAKILKRDASIVGAYRIVPLATIVGVFDDWHRRMAWYWRIACYMLPLQESKRASGSLCTGSALIDKLRNESQTGYPDIAEASIELLKVAETAWLRQLVPWIIYGKLPTHGSKDFFIQQLDQPHEQTFIKHQQLAPDFVTSSTGASIHFIGRCLHQVEHHRKVDAVSSALSSPFNLDTGLTNKHMQLLSSLALPLVGSQFSKVVSEIRLSLSQNVLQHLLPMTTTLQVLSCFRQFFLLERGAFATALVDESESRVRSRQQSMGRLLQQDPIKAMQGLNIKNADLGQALQQVWKALATEDSEEVDHLVEYARENMRLTIPKKTSVTEDTPNLSSLTPPVVSTIAFNDLLFPTPSELNLKIPPPLDLFLTNEDVSVYSAISSYLLALRRGHQKLSDLWRRTPARRDHPLASMDEPDIRKRQRRRAHATRKIWATCSAANFLLSETSAFLEAEIVKGSFNHFVTWLQSPAPDPDLEQSTISTKKSVDTGAQRDPETLATGHRIFLASLTYAILLSDTPYTHNLRSLLRNVDNLIAFFHRLLDIQQKLDTELQADGESPHTLEDAQKIALELDRSRKRVDSDMKMVVNRLRQLDHERIGSLRYLDVRSASMTDFDVWKGGGVDRLLMKLDFGRVPDEAFDIA